MCIADFQTITENCDKKNKTKKTSEIKMNVIQVERLMISKSVSGNKLKEKLS